MSRRTCIWTLTAWIAALSLPGGVFATDGVLEISEACAVNTGCFAGDSAGFPVTVANQGSYLFTSDLLTTDPNQDMVVIAADHVTINMNGFKIQGPTTCTHTQPPPPSQPATACVNTGSGAGFTDAGVLRRALAIQNGKITGMGTCIEANVSLGVSIAQIDCSFFADEGCTCGGLCSLWGTRISLGGGACLIASEGSLIYESIVFGCGADGMVVGEKSQIELANSSGVVGHGFVLAGGSILKGSIGSQNGGSGATVSCGGTRITGSVFNLNQDDGIRTTQNGGALDCAIHGVTASGNAGNALQVIPPPNVQPNILLDIAGFNAAGNMLFGLALPLSCPPGVPCATVRSSNFMRNAGGTISGSFIEAPIGSNVCDTNTTCP